MTDLENIHSKFLELEHDFQLWDRTIAGLPFWDYLRVPVYNFLTRNTGIFCKAHWHSRTTINTATNLKDRLLARWKNLEYWIFRNPFRQKSCDFLFIGHPRRKLGDDGTYWDIYCDPIIDYLGSDRCLVIEEPYCHTSKHMSPPHTKRLTYTDAVYFHNRIRRKKPVLSPRISSSEMDWMISLQDEVSKRFGVESENLIIDRFLKSYRDHHNHLNTYANLLKALKPKAVFLVCSYGKEAWVATFKKVKVPCIELQHGTIGPYHPGYAYPDPAQKSLFPDFFLSFGKYWEETTPLPLAKDRIFTIGYPYLDEGLKEYRATPKKRQVIIVSQWTLGDRFAQFALELREHLPENWDIVLKLHPGEYIDWQSRYPNLVHSNIRVIDQDRPPLYELLAESHIQIGAYSTAIFEGLALGCQTYLIDAPGIEYMQPLVEKGWAKVVNNAYEIDPTGETPNKNDVPDIFADGWRDNIDKALMQMMAISSGDLRG